MAIELHYTSVPKGLNPGTSGFCTVAITSGITASMIQRLESLSGYRPVFAMGSPDVARNPVDYAHWRANIGGKIYSILSRVCFAGSDHTQRSNKFAHHLVLESSEQTSAGPAWVLMQSGVMAERWTGDPRILPTGKKIPSGLNPPRVCESWQQITGDAGWAGVLAESFLLDASKPAYVLYEPGMDVLSLINEVIALLPEPVRWRVTFSTFFNQLPADLACTWRFCVVGTPAAKQAPASATSGVMIDLTSKLKPPRESRYVIAARTGQPVSAEQKVTAAPTPSPQVIAPARRTAVREPQEEQESMAIDLISELSPPNLRQYVAAGSKTDRRDVPIVWKLLALGWIIPALLLLALILYRTNQYPQSIPFGLEASATSRPSNEAAGHPEEQIIAKLNQRVHELEGENGILTQKLGQANQQETYAARTPPPPPAPENTDSLSKNRLDGENATPDSSKKPTTPKSLESNKSLASTPWFTLFYEPPQDKKSENVTLVGVSIEKPLSITVRTLGKTKGSISDIGPVEFPEKDGGRVIFSPKESAIFLERAKKDFSGTDTISQLGNVHIKGGILFWEWTSEEKEARSRLNDYFHQCYLYIEAKNKPMNRICLIEEQLMEVAIGSPKQHVWKEYDPQLEIDNPFPNSDSLTNGWRLISSLAGPVQIIAKNQTNIVRVSLIGKPETIGDEDSIDAGVMKLDELKASHQAILDHIDAEEKSLNDLDKKVSDYFAAKVDQRAGVSTEIEGMCKPLNIEFKKGQEKNLPKEIETRRNTENDKRSVEENEWKNIESSLRALPPGPPETKIGPFRFIAISGRLPKMILGVLELKKQQ